jgi:hypothetical protein
MKTEKFAIEIEGKMVDFIAVFGRHAPISTILSTELECTECKGKDHYAPYKFSSEYHKNEKDNRRVWLCANSKCPTMQLENVPSTYKPNEERM